MNALDSIRSMLFVSSNSAEKFNPMLEAFEAMEGLKVASVHRFSDLRDYYSRPQSLTEKLFEKLGYPRDKENHNERVLQAAANHSPDIVFVVKGNHIRPSTLKRLSDRPSPPILISWSQDDMFVAHNRSVYYRRGLCLYDLVVTQKSYNLNPGELPALGARKLLFQNKAFSPSIHRPFPRDPEFARDVQFVGTAELARFKVMNELASRGIRIHIFGSGWDRSPYLEHAHPNLRISTRNLLGKEYGRALSSARINLGFLRKQNRDLQTSRSIEIPACGSLMIAEMSEEHAALFTPDREAVYFSSVDEAEQKIRFFLANEETRAAIADAGFRKCYEAGYTYTDRAREILTVAADLRHSQTKSGE